MRSDAQAQLQPAADRLPTDVVMFSTADWDHPFWTNKQRVATQLAVRGFRVLYVESLGLRTPSVGARDLRRIGRRIVRSMAGPRQVADRVWVWSPLVLPVHGSAFVRRLNDRLLRTRLRRMMAQLGFERPLVWTYNPLTVGTAAKLDPAMLVYHAVDDLSSVPCVAGNAIRAAEQELVRQADTVFTTSTNLQSRLQPLQPGAVHYLPNVADYDHFAQSRTIGPIPDDLAAIPHPRIGFIGAVSSYKVDFGLIAEVARRRPDWHWVLIGQIGEGQPGTNAAELRLPNIHLLGPRDYGVLPDYLRGFDVATIPAASNPYTAAMFPMKFFEYLAAGRPVVAANVPALAPYGQACLMAESAIEFVAAIERIFNRGGPDPAVCDELARRHTWQWRTREMLSILEQTWTRKRSPRDQAVAA